jgi:hypothetical protein
MTRQSTLLLSGLAMFGCQRPGVEAGDEALGTTGDSSSDSTTEETSSTDSDTSETTSSDTTSDESSDSTESESTEESGETGAEGKCPEGLVVHVGDIDGATAADLDALIGVECLDGALLLSTGLTAPLTQLSSLQIIVGAVEIYHGGWELKSLTGLESLWWIQGPIYFNASSLKSLDGLNGLVEVGGAFQISTGHFDNLDALANLTTVHSNFTLGEAEGAPWIGHIKGLASLETVGSLYIYRTSGLTTLVGLENLQTVGSERNAGLIHISLNQHLVDVTPLGGGVALVIEGPLSIDDNPMLPTCNAMALADTLDVLGDIEIHGNLPDVCGG